MIRSCLGRRLSSSELGVSPSAARSISSISIVMPSPETMSRTDVDQLYRPFLLPASSIASDWTSQLDLTTVEAMGQVMITANALPPLKILLLYGSARDKSYSRMMTMEAARILSTFSFVDVRVFNPRGIPILDGSSHLHEKVIELRALTAWSDGQMWCSAEQHGTITGLFKTLIDHIPLNTASVRPTQGRTLAVGQVSGGGQSFNAVNQLRQLGRWMRMITIPNQFSTPKAWTQFDESDRMLPSSNRERLVDVVEELVKFTLLTKPHRDLFDDRYSEREERKAHGRLRTQGEVEAEKRRVELLQVQEVQEESKLLVKAAA